MLGEVTALCMGLSLLSSTPNNTPHLSVGEQSEPTEVEKRNWEELENRDQTQTKAEQRNAQLTKHRGMEVVP